ncbi:MAG: hypothetical protein ACTHK4_06245 [Mycobacteriales bacterium]
MALAAAFATTASDEQPTNGNTTGQGDTGGKQVSDFITVQSLTNFAAMTGAITTAWGGLQQASSVFDSRWLPFSLCMAFGLVSLLASQPGKSIAKWGPALFIALVNSVTLFGAVVGAGNVTGSS